MRFRIAIALAIGCFIVFGLNSFGAIKVSEKPRRFVFLIHGINGSEKTFGFLPQVLQIHGDRIQKDHDIQIIPLGYPTGRDEMDTYDFAREVGRLIKNKIGDLRPSDRITLVAHSQGGLVSWIWYLKSLMKENSFEEFFDLAKQTEGVMTIGTPYWGSKLASLGSSNESLQNVIRSLGLSAGRKELEQMSLVSDTITKFRRKAIALDRSGFKLPLRIQNVAGIMPRHDSYHLTEGIERTVPLGSKMLLMAFEVLFGNGINLQAETDLAVDVPSARANFIYQEKAQSPRSQKITAEDFTCFKDSAFRDLVIVRGVHASTNQEKCYDIAQVPQICASLEKPCDHPTYGLVLQFVMECTKDILNCDHAEYERLTNFFLSTPEFKSRTEIAGFPTSQQMHAFTLDLVFDMPPGYGAPEYDEEIKRYIELSRKTHQWGETISGFPERPYENPSEPGYYFLMDRLLESSATVIFQTNNFYDDSSPKASPRQIRMSLHGRVYTDDNNMESYQKFLKKGFKLPFKVKIPGFSERSVEALIKPTYSTFINLDFR